MYRINSLAIALIVGSYHETVVVNANTVNAHPNGVSFGYITELPEPGDTMASVLFYPNVLGSIYDLYKCNTLFQSLQPALYSSRNPSTYGPNLLGSNMAGCRYYVTGGKPILQTYSNNIAVDAVPTSISYQAGGYWPSKDDQSCNWLGGTNQEACILTSIYYGDADGIPLNHAGKNTKSVTKSRCANLASKARSLGLVQSSNWVIYVDDDDVYGYNSVYGYSGDWKYPCGCFIQDLSTATSNVLRQQMGWNSACQDAGEGDDPSGWTGGGVCDQDTGYRNGRMFCVQDLTPPPPTTSPTTASPTVPTASPTVPQCVLHPSQGQLAHFHTRDEYAHDSSHEKYLDVAECQAMRLLRGDTGNIYQDSFSSFPAGCFRNLINGDNIYWNTISPVSAGKQCDDTPAGSNFECVEAGSGDCPPATAYPSATPTAPTMSPTTSAPSATPTTSAPTAPTTASPTMPQCVLLPSQGQLAHFHTRDEYAHESSHENYLDVAECQSMRLLRGDTDDIYQGSFSSFPAGCFRNLINGDTIYWNTILPVSAGKQCDDTPAGSNFECVEAGSGDCPVTNTPTTSPTTPAPTHHPELTYLPEGQTVNVLGNGMGLSFSSLAAAYDHAVVTAGSFAIWKRRYTNEYYVLAEGNTEPWGIDVPNDTVLDVWTLTAGVTTGSPTASPSPSPTSNPTSPTIPPPTDAPTEAPVTPAPTHHPELTYLPEGQTVDVLNVGTSGFTSLAAAYDYAILTPGSFAVWKYSSSSYYVLAEGNTEPWGKGVPNPTVRDVWTLTAGVTTGSPTTEPTSSPTGSPTSAPSPYVSISDTLTCGSQSTESINCLETQYSDCTGNPLHGELVNNGVDMVRGFRRYRLWSVKTVLITYTTGHHWSDVCGVPSCTLPSEAFATECLAACVAGGYTECGITLFNSNYQCYAGSGTMSSPGANPYWAMDPFLLGIPAGQQCCHCDTDVTFHPTPSPTNTPTASPTLVCATFHTSPTIHAAGSQAGAASGALEYSGAWRAQTTTSTDIWFTADLGSVVPFGGIDLWTCLHGTTYQASTFCLMYFTISTSTDGVVWVDWFTDGYTTAEVADGSYASGYKTFIGPGGTVQARYVKIRAAATNYNAACSSGTTGNLCYGTHGGAIKHIKYKYGCLVPTGAPTPAPTTAAWSVAQQWWDSMNFVEHGHDWEAQRNRHADLFTHYGYTPSWNGATGIFVVYNRHVPSSGPHKFEDFIALGYQPIRHTDCDALSGETGQWYWGSTDGGTQYPYMSTQYGRPGIDPSTTTYTNVKFSKQHTVTWDRHSYVLIPPGCVVGASANGGWSDWWDGAQYIPDQWPTVAECDADSGARRADPLDVCNAYDHECSSYGCVFYHNPTPPPPPPTSSPTTCDYGELILESQSVDTTLLYMEQSPAFKAGGWNALKDSTPGPVNVGDFDTVWKSTTYGNSAWRTKYLTTNDKWRREFVIDLGHNYDITHVFMALGFVWSGYNGQTFDTPRYISVAGWQAPLEHTPPSSFADVINNGAAFEWDMSDPGIFGAGPIKLDEQFASGGCGNPALDAVPHIINTDWSSWTGCNPKWSGGYDDRSINTPHSPPAASWSATFCVNDNWRGVIPFKLAQPTLARYIAVSLNPCISSWAANTASLEFFGLGGSVCYIDGTRHPTPAPTAPTASPTTSSPSESPTAFPSRSPTQFPSAAATTLSPTNIPTTYPTNEPTAAPTLYPTKSPSDSPTADPTVSPTSFPTKSPTVNPTSRPTNSPTVFPTSSPSSSPTAAPSTLFPTRSPTGYPTAAPTDAPIVVEIVVDIPEIVTDAAALADMAIESAEVECESTSCYDTFCPPARSDTVCDFGRRMLYSLAATGVNVSAPDFVFTEDQRRQLLLSTVTFDFTSAPPDMAALDAALASVGAVVTAAGYTVTADAEDMASALATVVAATTVNVEIESVSVDNSNDDADDTKVNMAVNEIAAAVNTNTALIKPSTVTVTTTAVTDSGGTSFTMCETFKMMHNGTCKNCAELNTLIATDCTSPDIARLSVLANSIDGCDAEQCTMTPTASPTNSYMCCLCNMVITSSPTTSPTALPTTEPTKSPTTKPTKSPSDSPTADPTVAPTSFPTKSPTVNPTNEPTVPATSYPTENPTLAPTNSPTECPDDVRTCLDDGDTVELVHRRIDRGCQFELCPGGDGEEDDDDLTEFIGPGSRRDSLTKGTTASMKYRDFTLSFATYQGKTRERRSIIKKQAFRDMKGTKVRVFKDDNVLLDWNDGGIKVTGKFRGTISTEFTIVDKPRYAEDAVVEVAMTDMIMWEREARFNVQGYHINVESQTFDEGDDPSGWPIEAVFTEVGGGNSCTIDGRLNQDVCNFAPDLRIVLMMVGSGGVGFEEGTSTPTNSPTGAPTFSPTTAAPSPSPTTSAPTTDWEGELIMISESRGMEVSVIENNGVCADTAGCSSLEAAEGYSLCSKFPGNMIPKANTDDIDLTNYIFRLSILDSEPPGCHIDLDGEYLVYSNLGGLATGVCSSAMPCLCLCPYDTSSPTGSPIRATDGPDATFDSLDCVTAPLGYEGNTADAGITWAVTDISYDFAYASLRPWYNWASDQLFHNDASYPDYQHVSSWLTITPVRDYPFNHLIDEEICRFKMQDDLTYNEIVVDMATCATPNTLPEGEVGLQYEFYTALTTCYTNMTDLECDSTQWQEEAYIYPDKFHVQWNYYYVVADTGTSLANNISMCRRTWQVTQLYLLGNTDVDITPTAELFTVLAVEQDDASILVPQQTAAHVIYNDVGTLTVDETDFDMHFYEGAYYEQWGIHAMGEQMKIGWAFNDIKYINGYPVSWHVQKAYDTVKSFDVVFHRYDHRADLWRLASDVYIITQTEEYNMTDYNTTFTITPRSQLFIEDDLRIDVSIEWESLYSEETYNSTRRRLDGTVSSPAYWEAPAASSLVAHMTLVSDVDKWIEMQSAESAIAEEPTPAEDPVPPEVEDEHHEPNDHDDGSDWLMAVGFMCAFFGTSAVVWLVWYYSGRV